MGRIGAGVALAIQLLLPFVAMPLAGEWKIRLVVLISDFEEIRFDTGIFLR